MDLTVHVSKIVKDYLANNVDMNDGIAKVASDHNFNLEQTKRLVEECNKACYIDKLASTGEQTFDIADLGKVKEALAPKQEMKKVASAISEITTYGNFNAYGLESENSLVNAYGQAIEKCAETIGSGLTKLAELRKQAVYKMPALDGVDEVAMVSELRHAGLEKLSEEMFATINNIARNEKIRDSITEKRASIVGGVIKGVTGVAAKGAGKAVGFVAEAPLKRGLTPLTYGQSFNAGAKKVSSNQHGLTNSPEVLTEMKKEASLISSATDILRNAAPYALAMGAIGIGAAAARKMGGSASRMMTERQLDKAFGTIIENHQDIRGMNNAREYFDVVARHSPSLALDPMVAPTLIRQFDTFGGVDINTVGKLRDIEGGNAGKPVNAGNDFVTGMKSLVGVASGIPGLQKSELELKDMRFKRINEIAKQHKMNHASAHGPKVDPNKWDNE